MSDLISRSEAIEALDQHSYENGSDYAKTVELLNDLPAVDAVPVVHARWQEHHCTNCWAKCVTAKTPQDFVINVETPFCPYCGARMDGEAE